MSDFITIELEKDPRGFATLWLNRPEKNNAFNAEMISELTTAIDLIAADSSLRFLLLRGRGKHFSAGADLAWMQASAKLDYQANLRDAESLGALMYGLHALPLPTLAVVHGAAFGGAVGLASCCDMAIGADDALFCLSEVRIGLMPAVISPFVVQALGPRVARRYALTAERFSGTRAREYGLLAESCQAIDLDAMVDVWITNLLLNGPDAMQACKAVLAEVDTGALNQALRHYTQSAIASVRVSPEGQEGLNAFLEKRIPSWQESN